MIRKEELHTTDIIDVVISDAQITRLIKRSSLARRILRGLMVGDAYLSELARRIDSDPSNCQQCINGDSIRYARGLIDYGLVFRYSDRRGALYYGITDRGREILKKMSEVWEQGP